MGWRVNVAPIRFVIDAGANSTDLSNVSLLRVNFVEELELKVVLRSEW